MAKRKQIKRHRMFNGKEYHQSGESGSSKKSIAKERARRLRANGYNARIVELNNPKRYFVFGRKK